MTMGGNSTPEVTWQDGLPAEEYWAIDPSIKTETPVDSRGLIVVDELVEATKEYICPEYQWDGPNDKHHLYYYEALYLRRERSTRGRVPAYHFRELAVNKIYIPRRFHNVIHKVMYLPNMPQAEVMSQYVEAWDIAKNLFVNARNTVLAERGKRKVKGQAEHDRVDEEIMEEIMKNHFGEVARHLGALSLLPLEFRPFRLGRDDHASVSLLGNLLQHGKQYWAHEVLSPSRNQDSCPCLHCNANSSIITSVNT